MSGDLKDAPALGLYLAALWLSIVALPFAIYRVGIDEYIKVVDGTFKSIWHRHD